MSFESDENIAQCGSPWIYPTWRLFGFFGGRGVDSYLVTNPGHFQPQSCTCRMSILNHFSVLALHPVPAGRGRAKVIVSLPPQPLAALRPHILQEVPSSIMSNTRCDYLFRQSGFFSYDLNDMICAGSEDGSRDACKVSAPAPGRALLEPGTTPSQPRTWEQPLGCLSTHPQHLFVRKQQEPIVIRPGRQAVFCIHCTSFDPHLEFGGGQLETMAPLCRCRN